LPLVAEAIMIEIPVDQPIQETGSSGSSPTSLAAAPDLWRSLVRVVGISTADAERIVEAVIPSWDPGRKVRFRESILPEEIQLQLAPGVRLLADVNLGETDPEKLVFRDFRRTNHGDTEAQRRNTHEMRKQEGRNRTCLIPAFLASSEAFSESP
jgi:hypothetical protein